MNTGKMFNCITDRGVKTIIQSLFLLAALAFDYNLLWVQFSPTQAGRARRFNERKTRVRKAVRCVVRSLPCCRRVVRLCMRVWCDWTGNNSKCVADYVGYQRFENICNALWLAIVCFFFYLPYVTTSFRMPVGRSSIWSVWVFLFAHLTYCLLAVRWCIA